VLFPITQIVDDTNCPSFVIGQFDAFSLLTAPHRCFKTYGYPFTFVEYILVASCEQSCFEKHFETMLKMDQDCGHSSIVIQCIECCDTRTQRGDGFRPQCANIV